MSYPNSPIIVVPLTDASRYLSGKMGGIRWAGQPTSTWPSRVGKKLVRVQEVETVLVRSDACDGQWVFHTEMGEELVRHQPKDLDAHILTLHTP